MRAIAKAIKVKVLREEVAELQKQKEAFEAALLYAKTVNAPIWNIEDTSTQVRPTYTRYTQEQLLEYMQAPATNAKNIRDASIYMYDASEQYKQLCAYYAYLNTWAYYLSPVDFDGSKIPVGFQKSYQKALSTLERMNLEHELRKSMLVAVREGIFYGAIWQSSTEFFITRIDPNYCSPVSIEDGTWMYAVDMSKIQEKKLMLYPPEFTAMWEEYQSTGQKYQIVPASISFCIKFDETNPNYSVPPFAALLPMLYQIEQFKALQETASKIDNYKLLALKIPTNTDGQPAFSWDLAYKYYQHLCNALPKFVGAAMSPMEITDHAFQQSGGINNVDIVARADNNFWAESGSSALLHGAAAGNSAGVLKLSIKADEEFTHGVVEQIQRLINRFLKNLTGTIKFKIRFLGSTIYNQEELVKQYKEAATLGIPGTKTAYASLLKISPFDILPMQKIEDDILGMDELKPLVSGYNTAVKTEGTKPQIDDTNLTDEGGRTKDGGKNDL